MAITRLGGANAITGTIPQGNIANASLGAVTALPAAIPTGKVLQVVMGSTGTETTNTSNDWADTSLTVTITPSSSSSKVYIAVSQNELYTTSANVGISVRLLRDSTSICQFANYVSYSSADDFNGESCNFLDSPSSTSALTYKIQFKPSGGSAMVKAQSNSGVSTITAMEIAG
jgi:hypothetical protein